MSELRNIIDQMISQQILHQRFYLKPYRCPNGRLFIGFGRNLNDKGITKAEAIILLENDIKECIDDLKTIFLDFDHLPESVQMVLLDMRLNLGKEQFLHLEKIIAAVKDHDFEKAANEIQNVSWASHTQDHPQILTHMIRQVDAFSNPDNDTNHKKTKQYSQTKNDLSKINLQLSAYSIVETESIGPNTRIWSFTKILAGAVIGSDCNICDHVFIENDVRLGDRVTVKCGVQLWDGIRVEDDVFIGPNATFTNDLFPRSKQYPEKFQETILRKGCSIGANATILCGIEIGERAIVGAGSVVTKNVPPDAIVYGNPAVVQRYIK